MMSERPTSATNRPSNHEPTWRFFLKKVQDKSICRDYSKVLLGKAILCTQHLNRSQSGGRKAQGWVVQNSVSTILVLSVSGLSQLDLIEGFY
jgi:hypothetical protein